MLAIRLIVLSALLCVSSCRKSVHYFHLYPFPPEATVEADNWQFLAEVSVISEGDGGFSKAGMREVSVTIKNQDGIVVSELILKYANLILLETVGHWTAGRSAVFILNITTSPQPYESSAEIRFTVEQ